MELKIHEIAFPKAIEFNYEDIKKEIAEKLQHYANLVYTDEQIKVAKTDRATLRKFIDALETKRKEIKKQCLEPYEAFEKQMKEIVAVVNEPVLLIDKQVKNFEERQKEEKREEIKKYWESTEIQLPIPLTLEQLFDEKWLNASVKMSTIQTEIESKLTKITNDLDILANLPEFSFEAIEVYKDTLDLNKAINEGKRLSELMKRKAEAEAKAEAETISKMETVETPKPVETAPTISPETETRRWVGFEAYITTDEARALRDFFVTRNISFRSPQKN